MYNSGKSRKKSYISSTMGQATGLSFGLDLTAHHSQALLFLLEDLWTLQRQSMIHRACECSETDLTWVWDRYQWGCTDSSHRFLHGVCRVPVCHIQTLRLLQHLHFGAVSAECPAKINAQCLWSPAAILKSWISSLAQPLDTPKKMWQTSS